MPYYKLKKGLLIGSVALFAVFGLSACGDNKKSEAPKAAPAGEAASEAPAAMDNVKDAVTEKANEVISNVKEKAAATAEEVKVKVTDTAAKAKQDAIDKARQKAADELKKRLPQ